MRTFGVDQLALRAAGQVFAVRRVAADYLAPARFDDILDVRTRMVALRPARVVLEQSVWRGGDRLFVAEVMLVLLGPDGRPRRMPAELRRAAGR